MHDKTTQTEKSDFQKAKLKAKLSVQRMQNSAQKHINPIVLAKMKTHRNINDSFKPSETKSFPTEESEVLDVSR